MNTHTRWAWLAMLAVGCDAPEAGYVDDDLGAVEERLLANNGMVLNGMVLNGMVLNGMVLNGTVLSGTLAVSQLPVAGHDLVGAVFHIERTSDAAAYELRIDAITPLAGHPDVNEYMLSARQPGVTTWESACKDSQGQAITAIPIPDAVWNETTGARIETPGAVAFACRNGALAKCVAWGYRPWGADVSQCDSNGAQCQTISMRDAHQACTRMVRADFCGNGQSWTLNGTPLDISDRFEAPIQERATDWGFEASWTPSGAACVARYRQEWMGFPSCNGNPPPICDGMSLDDYRSLDSITDTMWDAMPGFLVSAFPLTPSP